MTQSSALVVTWKTKFLHLHIIKPDSGISYCQAERGSTLRHNWGKSIFSFTQILTLKVQQEMRRGPLLAWRLLELSTVCDSDLLGGSPSPWTKSLNFLDHVHSLFHAAKHNMLPIQPKWRRENIYWHCSGQRAHYDAPNWVYRIILQILLLMNLISH